MAVVPLAGDKVDECGEQPAGGPYAGFQFIEVAFDILVEHVGNFLRVLSEGPASLGIDIEEDEAEGGSRSGTVSNRGPADIREDDSHKLVNLLFGMNAMWILFRFERDTSLQAKRVSLLPFHQHTARSSTHNLLRYPMHGHNVEHIPHNVHIHSSTPTDARNHPLPVLHQLVRHALIHTDPSSYTAIHPQSLYKQFPGGGMLEGLIKSEEEPMTIGEVLYRLAVYRLERAHVPQNALDAFQCVDGLAVRDGCGGRWKRLISLEDTHVFEVLFHLIRSDEGEAGKSVRGIWREGMEGRTERRLTPLGSTVEGYGRATCTSRRPSSHSSYHERHPGIPKR